MRNYELDHKLEHIYSLAAYAAVVGVLQIPILVTVFRIRTIDLMED